MPPRLHLGVNTCFAVKRWPEPERWVALVRELGVGCCQFSLDLVDPLLDEAATGAYAEDVRRHAEAAGVEVHSTFSGLAAYSWSQLLHPERAMRDAAMHWYERAITMAGRMGASATGGHLGAFSVADAANAARRAALLEELAGRLETLTRRAAAAGLRALLCENMAVPREWGHTLEEARQLTRMGAPDGVPLVLCLDVGHPCALRAGSPDDDPLAWLAEPWPHTPVLHLQQTDAGGDRHWPFTPPYNRQGRIHPEAILEAIGRWSPEGAGDVYLFLEVIHPFEAGDETVLSDLRASVDYWRAALERCERGAVGERRD